MKNSIRDVLKHYQEQTEKHIRQTLSAFQKGPNRLKEACKYALLNGGKRFRPALVFILAELIGKNHDVSKAALAVEFFHTASLIADDLPCMDDETERRGKAALHHVYGEATSLLASYALISAGYDLLACNSQALVIAEKISLEESGQILFQAIKNVAKNTGLEGAAGGQYYDLYPETLSTESLKQVFEMKTGTLFEISFVLGWIYGGGSLLQIEKIQAAAKHFGMAFQILDDFDDAEEDAKEARQMNICNLLGKKAAEQLLKQEFDQMRTLLTELHLNSKQLFEMLELLRQRG